MATPSFTPKNFPGVYTQIIDKSFFSPRTSRFKPGLIGVASKGPFNTPTVVRSLKDFVEKFGSPITTTYSTNDDGNEIPSQSGYFLADAVDSCIDYTNEMTIVRIGKTSEDLEDDDCSGDAGSQTVTTAANYTRIADLITQGHTVYVNLREAGIDSTINALVTSASNGTVGLSAETLLESDYTTATMSFSLDAEAANSAEGILYCYTYGTDSSDLTDSALDVGDVVGNKNAFQFTVEQNADDIAVGDVFKITQTDKVTTHEVRVSARLVNEDGSGTIFIEKTNKDQVGYQALPLQDTYTAGVLYKATGHQRYAFLKAATEGTWANGSSSKHGLYTKVRPGSKPGTKKVEVYWNSALVETHDNLTSAAADTDNSIETRLKKGVSSYVYVEYVSSVNTGWIPANAAEPWDSRYRSGPDTVQSVKTMPVGALNAGKLTISGTATDTGGQFAKGHNGENASASDWIGTLDQSTDRLTGLHAFENTRRIDVNVIAAPMHDIDLAVINQIADTCNKIKAYAVVDIPAGYNGRLAVDWHNGQLPSQDGRKIDAYNVGFLWNWGYTTNRFGETKLVPPSVLWLARAGYTFNAFAPWYAIAGETRGYLPKCQAVQYSEVSEDTLEGMYGNGNCVNPILDFKGVFYIYGERTSQRTESKLTAAHSVICINHIVKEMAKVARRYIFDPNDAQLLETLNVGFTEVLARAKNDRGVEWYNLNVTASAENRNNREVVVDLAVIPTDVAERIYINASVYESGNAIINSIS